MNVPKLTAELIVFWCKNAMWQRNSLFWIIVKSQQLRVILQQFTVFSKQTTTYRIVTLLYGAVP